jgi:ribosomal protein S18 acetylase RimI-like enzyme
MDDNVVFRRGNAQDIEAALAVWTASRLARDGVLSAASDFDRHRDAMLVPDSLLIVGERSGATVAMAVAVPEREDRGKGARIPGQALIHSVYVLPDYWGRGVGRKLVSALLSALSQDRYVLARLWTNASNHRARRLYETLGFHLTDLNATNHRGAPIVQYERNLPSDNG